MVALVAETNPPLPEPPAEPATVVEKKQTPDSSIEEVMKRIEHCESRGNPNAKNPHSTAKGLFQFLDGTWKHYGLKHWGTLEGRDVYDPEDNRELAEYVITNYGTRDWNASKHCWGYPHDT